MQVWVVHRLERNEGQKTIGVAYSSEGAWKIAEEHRKDQLRNTFAYPTKDGYDKQFWYDITLFMVED